MGLVVIGPPSGNPFSGLALDPARFYRRRTSLEDSLPFFSQSMSKSHVPRSAEIYIYESFAAVMIDAIILIDEIEILIKGEPTNRGNTHTRWADLAISIRFVLLLFFTFHFSVIKLYYSSRIFHPIYG